MSMRINFLSRFVSRPSSPTHQGEPITLRMRLELPTRQEPREVYIPASALAAIVRGGRLGAQPGVASAQPELPVDEPPPSPPPVTLTLLDD